MAEPVQWLPAGGGPASVMATTRWPTSGLSGGMRDGRVLSRQSPAAPSSLNRSCQRQITVLALPVACRSRQCRHRRPSEERSSLAKRVFAGCCGSLPPLQARGGRRRSIECSFARASLRFAHASPAGNPHANRNVRFGPRARWPSLALAYAHRIPLEPQRHDILGRKPRTTRRRLICSTSLE
jgi:hypothetical protein